MRAMLVFHNDDPLLANLEKENEFAELDLDFDLAKTLLVGDTIRWRVKNDLGLDQEIFLIVDNRTFDLIERILIIDCDVLVDGEDTGGNITYYQHPN